MIITTIIAPMETRRLVGQPGRCRLTMAACMCVQVKTTTDGGRDRNQNKRRLGMEAVDSRTAAPTIARRVVAGSG